MRLRKTGFLLALVLASVFVLSGCNKNDAEATDASEAGTPNTTQAAGDEAIENAFEGSEKPVDNNSTNAGELLGSIEGTVDEARPTTIPFEPTIIRSNDGGATETSEAVETPAFTSEGDISASGNSVSKTPVLFEAGDPTVFVVGSYNDAYCDELIAAVNAKRAVFGVPAAVKNPSLCLCANTRARETSFFNSHTRPNGTPFNTVASKYFMAECTSVTLKNATPQFIVDNWMDSYYCRHDMLDKDYMSIGACYFTTGDYAIGVITFGY